MRPKSSGEKPYVYRPENTADDLKTLQMLDEVFDDAAVHAFAKQNRISPDAAREALYEGFLNLRESAQGA